MDMAFVAAVNASRSFPPHDPWMAGEELNYYYFGHLAWRSPSGCGVGRTRATTSRSRCSSRSRRPPCSRWAARCGPRRGPARRARGPVAAAFWPSWSARAREPRRRGGVARRGEPAARLRLVRAVARDPGHDHRVPGVLVPAAGPPRPCARDAVHAGGARLRAPGRAHRATRRRGVAGRRRGARRRARDRGRSTPSTPGRIRSPPVCSCSRWRCGASGDAARGRRAYAAVWLGLVLAASVALLLPFWLAFDPARARARAGRGARAVHGVHGRPGADLRGPRLAARRRLRRAPRSPPAGRGGPRPGARWRRSSRGSLLATADLAGPAALAAVAAVALGALFSRRLGAGERFVWLLVAGGLICVAAPGARVRARRVRRGRRVPDEHGLQARLPGAGCCSRVAAACVLPWAGAGCRAGLARRGGRWRRSWCARRRVPVRGDVRAQGRLRGARRRSTGSLAGERSPGDVAAIDWLRAQHRRPARWCSRRSGTTTRSSATPASRRSRAGARCSAGPATSSSGATTRGRGGRTSAPLPHPDLAEARELRPLRGRLRRRRADRAHGLRRRRWRSGTGSATRVFDRDGTAVWRFGLDPPVIRRENGGFGYRRS